MHCYAQTNAPIRAAIAVKRIGFILKRIFAMAVAAKTAVRKRETVLSGSLKTEESRAPGLSRTPFAIVMAAAAIRPTAAGFTPERKALVILFSLKRFKKCETREIIMKEGRETPKVAAAAPQKPA